jgi:hypothetical protein
MERQKHLTATEVVYTEMLTISLCVAALFFRISGIEKGQTSEGFALHEDSTPALPKFTRIHQPLLRQHTCPANPLTCRDRRP